jgi:hypothetical protein
LVVILFICLFFGLKIIILGSKNPLKIIKFIFKT